MLYLPVRRRIRQVSTNMEQKCQNKAQIESNKTIFIADNWTKELKDR